MPASVTRADRVDPQYSPEARHQRAVEQALARARTCFEENHDVSLVVFQEAMWGLPFAAVCEAMGRLQITQVTDGVTMTCRMEGPRQ